MKVLNFLLLFLIIPTLCFGGVDLEQTSSQFLLQADGLSTDISGADQKISISLWFRPENMARATDNNVLISKADSGIGNRQYYLMVREGSFDDVFFQLSNDGSSSSNAIGASKLTAGNNYQIGAVYNDTDQMIYLNGALDSNGVNNPKSYTSGIYNGNANFAIGAIYSSGSPSSTNFSDGIIDDVCIWDIDISADEMSFIYNSKVKGICRQIKTSNLKLYCALDSCSEGSSCTGNFTCYPGSDMQPQNTPIGSAETVLSYP